MSNEEEINKKPVYRTRGQVKKSKELGIVHHISVENDLNMLQKKTRRKAQNEVVKNVKVDDEKTQVIVAPIKEISKNASIDLQNPPKVEVKEENIEDQCKVTNTLNINYHLKIPLESFVKGTLLRKEKKNFICEIIESDKKILDSILDEAFNHHKQFKFFLNNEEISTLIKKEVLETFEEQHDNHIKHNLDTKDISPKQNQIIEKNDIKIENIDKTDNNKIDKLGKNEIKVENIENKDNNIKVEITEKKNIENENIKEIHSNFIKEEEEDNLSSDTFAIREVTIELLPEDFNLDKIKEAFFTFGDITNIEMMKTENKAYVKYKLCSSAKRALDKMLNPINNPRGLKVSLSNRLYRSAIEGDDMLYVIETFNKQNLEEGRVVYLRFNESTSVPEIDELKKSLKRYGHIGKVFKRKGKRTIYVEFSNEASARDLVKDFRNKKYNWNSNNDLQEINYVFLKRNKKDVLEEKDDIKNAYLQSNKNLTNTSNTIVDQNNQNQTLTINHNHYWEIHYDDNYKRNYYFNPFLNESVWELPEGAMVSPFQYSNYNYNNDQVKTEINKANDLIEDDKSDSYFDDEAWDEGDLMEKMIWDRMKNQQLKEWMKRPARQQVADTRRDTAYIEGNYDYNIWYDKYLTDRKEEREKIPAMHKSNPTLDTGYTKADLQEKEGGAYFCMYFAKGCCAEGVNCRYYHRVPTKEDADKIENLRDVFGRSRFATHRNDMGGVGTFTKECRTLYVSDIKMIDTANPVKEMVRVIYENFSPWGEIEDINYIPTKGICFIRYSHRCFAEFAKEAMMDQSLIGEEVLGVKWAYDDPNPMSKKRMEKENENRFLSAYVNKKDNLEKKNKGKKINKDFNNKNYFDFYNNVNNPYVEANYSSGYGNDEVNNNNVDVHQRQVQEMTNNCVKLSETLKMIDENFYN